jgi:hypothetical protein
MLLAHGRALYSGPGAFAPVEYFASKHAGVVKSYEQGYNVAEYLLDVASDPPVSLFQMRDSHSTTQVEEKFTSPSKEKTHMDFTSCRTGKISFPSTQSYETTSLTQLQTICGREWKILRRDYTLFFTHVIASAILGVFCGKLNP